MENKNKTIFIVAIISAVILVIALVALFLYKPVASTSNTIQVQGNGQVKAMPDLISVYFNVETSGVNASEASEKNSKIYDSLVSSLVAFGFNEKEITTDSFSVYEDFSYINGYQKSNGFKAVHSVKLVLNNDTMNLVGTVVDTGINAGASVNSINFELSQEMQNKYKADSIKLAAEDAKIKADALASGFGKQVGKLVSVTVNDFGYMPWNIYSASGSSNDVVSVKEAAANIQPGQEEIDTSVTAVYKLA